MMIARHNIPDPLAGQILFGDHDFMVAVVSQQMLGHRIGHHLVHIHTDSLHRHRLLHPSIPAGHHTRTGSPANLSIMRRHRIAFPPVLLRMPHTQPETQPPMLTRRRFAQLASLTSASLALRATSQPPPPKPDFTLDIAPYLLEASPKHRIQTIAYNNQVPGPLLRMPAGRPVTVEVHNKTPDPEIVHWHGLHLPSAADGAMEEGSPMIPPGASTRLTFTPDPAGFRWFHTHTFAGKDYTKAQYGGQHGFLMIDPAQTDANPAHYDHEFFLALHDWQGRDEGGNDGSMNPVYDLSTINGKILGAGEPLRVRPSDIALFHILNSSPTEVHWLALPGHTFKVIALDGNPVPTPASVAMLRLAPAERVSALVTLSNPGLWILGEVRKHIQAAGMGIVLEYANSTGDPKWIQPATLTWNYADFAGNGGSTTLRTDPAPATPITLTFDSKFHGHGAQETWTINGRSYPDTEEPILHAGERYRLILKNLSMDDHPLHLHRHTFDLIRQHDSPVMQGLRKDVILVPARTSTEIEFTANNPGRTLFHCHQQNHMDRGFMMVFRYA